MLRLCEFARTLEMWEEETDLMLLREGRPAVPSSGCRCSYGEAACEGAGDGACIRPRGLGDLLSCADRCGSAGPNWEENTLLGSEVVLLWPWTWENRVADSMTWS